MTLSLIPTRRYSTWNLIPDFDKFQKRQRKAYYKFVGDDNDWDIFEACEISMRAQQQISKGGYVRTLTYGEVDYESVARIIHIIKYHYSGLGKGMTTL